MEQQHVLAAVQAAILQERARREYAVVIGPARKAFGIAGVRLPSGIESYVVETACTVQHESGIPCLWIDHAFRLPDGSFRVVLQNDLVRPGLMIEESVRALFRELVESGENAP